MFKLTQSPTFWAKVDVEYAAEKGGKQTVQFEVKLRRLTMDELTALQDRIRSEKLDDATVARELVQDWRGIAADDGSPAEFNEGNFEQLLSLGVAGGIVAAFFTNLPRAKQKN